MKKFISLALALFFVFAVAAPVMAKTNPINVLKNGEEYAAVETYPSNSSANKGMKISANKTWNDIMLGGVVVGRLYFDKNADTIEITIARDVTVDVEWHCSKYYAQATLDGVGTYSLPRLMQDNGKYQGFDQIWIVNGGKASVVVSYERYTAYVEIWNDFYTNPANTQYYGILRDSGGLAHYYELLKYYSANELPPYFQFDASMKSVYDYWADELEPGLLEVCAAFGIDLQSYVINHQSNK